MHCAAQVGWVKAMPSPSLTTSSRVGTELTSCILSGWPSLAAGTSISLEKLCLQLQPRQLTVRSWRGSSLPW